MKKIVITLFVMMSAILTYGAVSYDASTNTLTVIGSTNTGEIQQYPDATTLIIQDVEGLNNMANQYGQALPNIEKLILPADVSMIPNQTFKNCKKLHDINWADLTNLKIIGDEAFMCTAIGPTFYVPNSVEEIRHGAFEACNNIKTLIFDENSQIQHIYSRAFYQSENTTEGRLSDVYINVHPAREIICDHGAFDKYHTSAQTQMGTVMTRLHYPPELYAYYVGLYKSQLYDQNYDVKDEEGHWKLDEHGNRIHSYGIVTQSIIDQAYGQAGNGWQEFFSSGIPVGTESLYRTYSDKVAYIVPYTSEFQVYLVYDYNKDENVAYCVQMNYGDLIPANTGIIVHSNVVGTIYMEYVENPDITVPYNNESNPDNLYLYEYRNYLKPINGQMHIDNVEIVNGVKTYRNYFFNNGQTAASRPAPDWDDKYLTEGWGFFRAGTSDYRVFNKAFLHLPASMTDASSGHIDDSGTLPQDNQSAASFAMYVMNGEDMVIECDGIHCEEDIVDNIDNIYIYKEDNNYYTLSGIRVKHPTKGIYIKNKRKIIVR